MMAAVECCLNLFECGGYSGSYSVEKTSEASSEVLEIWIVMMAITSTILPLQDLGL